MSTAGSLILIVLLVMVGAYFFNQASSGNIHLLQVSPSLLRPNSSNFKPGSGFASNLNYRAPSKTNSVSYESQASPTVESRPLTNLPAGVTPIHLSSYFGRVRITSLDAGSPTSIGKVTLQANFQSGPKIDITGWQLQARHGGIYIPQAVNVYDPLGVNPATDIYLDTGETVNIYTNISPLGTNIRLNLCIGYLGNNRRFNPGLPRDCPRPDRLEVHNFSSQCEDYALSLGTCEEPKSNPPIPNWDVSCRDYLSHFNYQGCFNFYSGRPDFLSKEWRIWTNTVFLNPRHDRLFLLDPAGLIVDFREY